MRGVRSHHQALLRNNLKRTTALNNSSHSCPSRFYSQTKFDFRENPEVPFLERIGLRRKEYREIKQEQKATMSHKLYTDETPDDVKNAKGIHLLTMSTPNGQAVQIYLEELKDVYNIEWTTTLVDIMTNDQKKDWFLRLDPNGLYIFHRTSYVTSGLTTYRPHPSDHRQYSEPTIPSHGNFSRNALPPQGIR